MIEDFSTSICGDRGGRGGHGEAALVLVESLIHGLVSRNGISLRDTVEIALDARNKIKLEPRVAGVQQDPAMLLQAISTSLQHDLVGDD